MLERLSTNNGTGVAPMIDTVLFDELDHIVVYPVQDESHWTDGDGKVLPDAFGRTLRHSSQTTCIQGSQ
jgi:ribosome-binding ATPase YchF (GTP1/OBG family)